MKRNKIFTLVTLLLTAAILAGCQGEDAGTVLTPNTQKVVQPEVSPISDNTVPIISGADTAAYDGAMQLRDNAFCDKIQDQSYKSICQSNLADKLALDVAEQKADFSLCEKLSTDDKREACKITIETNKETDKRMQPPSDPERELYKKAYATRDKSLCEKIENIDYKNSCFEIVKIQ